MMNKGVISALMVLILLSTVSALSIQTTVTEEVVSINITNATDDLGLKIKVNKDVYNYRGGLDQEILFKPQGRGIYELTIYNKSNFEDILFKNISVGIVKRNASISTNKTNYTLGETVELTILGVNDSDSVVISSERVKYQFLDEITSSIIFSPVELGAYSAEILNQYKEVIAKVEFNVVGEDNETRQDRIDSPQEIDTTISTNKKQYFPNETVLIFVENVSRVDRIILQRENESFVIEQISENISFVAAEVGKYSVQAFFNGSVIAKTSFEVLEKPAEVIDFIINLPKEKPKAKTPTFFIRNNKEEQVHAKIQFFQKGALQKEINSKRSTFRTTSSNDAVIGVYDVEIIPESSSVKSLKLANAVVNDSLNVGIDDLNISQVNLEKNVVKSFAIDPESVQFDNGSARVQATGNALFKCKDWNFKEQTCFGDWIQIMDLVPGEDYDIEISPKDPGFAEVNLTIITVQSFPSIGGVWEVAFNTSGKANLTIRAVESTSWSIYDDNHIDLKFLELRCGNVTQSYEWINETIFVEDYECFETGYEKSRVFTGGKHKLEFTFGDSIGYANNFADQDFLVQRLTITDFGAGEDTATYTLDQEITDLKYAFINPSSTSKVSGGPTGSTGTKEADDVGVTIELISTTQVRVTRETTGVNEDQRIEFEVIEYVGPPGAPNEFIVRAHGTMSQTGGGNTSANLSGIINVDNVVPIMTGIRSNTVSNGGDDLTAILYTPNATDLIMQRASTGGTTVVSYAVVEFTGSNWEIGHAQHEFGATTEETFTMYREANASNTVFDVTDWNTAFIEFTYQAQDTRDSLDEASCTIREGASTTTMRADLNAADNVAGGNYIVQAHAIRNQNFTVQWLRPGDPGGGDDDFTVGITQVDNINTTSVHGSLTSSGNGEAYHRHTRNFRLDDVNNIGIWGHRTGNTLVMEAAVVQWPTVPRIFPNVTLISPDNNTINNSRSINFTFNVSTPRQIHTCAVYTNESGWGQKETNSTEIITEVYNGLIHNFSSDGFFQWNIFCNDTFTFSSYGEHNRTIKIDTSPNMTGTVSNDGPVDAGDNITFSGLCQNNGDEFRLLVCNASASSCDASTPAAEIICDGENGTTNTPTCRVEAQASQGGQHVGDSASCCDLENNCEPSAVLVETWNVRAPPSIIEEASDQNSSAVNPTLAGNDVKFTIVGEDPNGDDYFILICPTNATNPGQGDCEFGQNRYCWSKGSEVASNVQAQCNYTTVANTDSADITWFAFACDNQTAPNTLCSEGVNGTAHNGSPFFVNNPPDLSVLSANVSFAKEDDDVFIQTLDADDQENQSLYLQCGNETGNYSLCSGPLGQPEVNCSANFAWNDNAAHSYYCIINDSFSVSSEVTISVTADNLAPLVNNTLVNDSDSIVRSSDIFHLNVTAVDEGSGVVNVSAANTLIIYLNNTYDPVWDGATSAADLGCVDSDGNCTITFTARDNVSLLNQSVTFDITVDDVPPNVSNPQTNDSDRIMRSTDTIQLNITVADSNSVENVSVGNTTQVLMGQISTQVWELNTTLASLGCSIDDGNCSLRFIATDVAGNINNTIEYALALDDIAPNVSNVLINNSDRIVQSTQLFVINVTVEDSNSVVNVTIRNDTDVPMSDTGNDIWEATTTAAALGCSETNDNCTLHIVASDVAANANGSIYYDITVDDINPGVDGIETNDSDLVVSAVQILNFNVTVSDLHGVFNVTLQNESNIQMTQVSSTLWSVNTSAQALGCTAINGDCIVQIVVTDYADNVNSSENITLSIDDITPSVTDPLTNASNNLLRSTDTFNINVTVFDLNTIVNVTVGNETVVGMNELLSTLWDVNTTPQALGCTATDGNCTLTFIATDVVGNMNDSTLLYLEIDDQPPTVLNANTNDSDNIVRSTDILNISVDVNDTHGVSEVSANSSIFTQTGILWYSLNSTSQFGCTNGQCLLHFSAEDSLGNLNNSELINITVDDEEPGIELNNPIDAFESTTNSISFEFTALDNVDGSMVCNVSIDGVANNTSPIDAVNGTNTIYIVNDFNEGSYVWNVSCSDDIPNTNGSETRSFIIDLTPPLVELEAPANNTLETATNTITFEYNVSDAASDISSCSLVINDEVNGVADTTISEGVTQQFERSLSNGDYTWQVNCTDSQGKEGNSTIYNISVNVLADETAPLVQLNYPDTNAYLNNGSVDFNYTPSDSTGILNCSFFLNGVENETCGGSGEYLPGFSRRQEINISENSGEELSEYQIMLTIDTESLISASSMRSDCGDMRFATQDFEMIPYYIENSSYIGCNQPETRVWIQMPVINASLNNSIYMFYGNAGATSAEDKYDVFNYTEPTPIMYIVQSLIDSPGDLSLISFRDGNDIRVGSNIFTLNETNQTTVVDTTYIQSDSVNATEMVYGTGTGGAQDAIVPASFAGTEFVNTIGRGTQQWSVYSPYGDATVEVYDGQGGSGFVLVGSEFTVTEGTATTVTREIDGTGTGTTNQNTFRINSTLPVLVYHHDATRDAMPIYPVTNDQWCFVTRYHIGWLENNTACNILLSDGTNTSSTYSEAEELFLDYGTGTRGEDGVGVHITCNNPVGSHEFADEDGAESAVCLPEIELDNEYFFTNDGQYVAITSPHPSTNCDVITPEGSSRFSGTSTATASYPFPSRLHFGANGATNIFAGDRLVCDHAVYVYYEDVNGDASGDERNVWNIKQARKLAYPAPTYTVGSEQAETSSCQITNAEINTFNISGIPDGTYEWNISCYDNSTNRNIGFSEVRNVTIDTSPPHSFDLETPVNNTISSNTIPFFNWTNTSDLSFANYTVEVDDTLDFSSIVFTYQSYEIDNTSIFGAVSADTTWYWRVIAMDLGNNNFTTGSFVYTTDNTLPLVALNEPANDSWDSTGTIELNYTPTDIHLNNCSIYGNFSGSWVLIEQNTTVVSGSKDTSNPLSPGEGRYIWNVQCADLASNSRYNESNFSINIDTTPPNITLNAPVDYLNTSATSISFNFTSVDNLASSYTCDLEIDNQDNVTGISVDSQVNEIVTVNNFAEGIHTWNVSCVDLAGNVNFTAIRQFTTDLSGPIINLESPVNNSEFDTPQNVIFRFNTTDTFTNISNCSLIFNGLVNVTNTSIQEGISQSFEVFMDGGEYNWSVNCTDTVGNVDSSEPYALSVQPPVFINVVFPDEGTEVDRDSVNSTASDNTTLIVSLSDERESESVTFYANLTSPAIAGESTLVLGTVLSNSTGHAALNFSGRNSVGNKLFAGNYSWWAQSGIYEVNTTGNVVVRGGLNVTFRFPTELPNLLYGTNQTVTIHEFLKSRGPESDAQINGTYHASVNTTLFEPNGTNYTVILIDPNIPKDRKVSYGNIQKGITFVQSADEGVAKLRSKIIDGNDRKVAASMTFYRDDRFVERVEKSKGILGVFEDVGWKSSPTLAVDTYDVEIIPQHESVLNVTMEDVEYAGELNLGLDEVDEETINVSFQVLDAFALDPSQINFTKGTMTFRAQGNAFYKCKQWNFTEQRCFGQWVQLMKTVPGEIYTLDIDPLDPGFVQGNITIINVQSYPTVGGNWSVFFNTSGTADLKIKAHRETTMSIDNESVDLRFLEIKCGQISLPYEFENETVTVFNYTCSEQGTEVSKVLTPGKHYLEFTFGEDTEYAKNFASYEHVIGFEDWEDSFFQRTTGACGTNDACDDGSGNFSFCIDDGNVHHICSTTLGAANGSRSGMWDDLDAVGGVLNASIWGYEFDPNNACSGLPCDNIIVEYYLAPVSLDDANEQCWVRAGDATEEIALYGCAGALGGSNYGDNGCEADNDPPVPSDYDFHRHFLNETTVDLTGSIINVTLGGYMPGGADHCYWDNFNVTGYHANRLPNVTSLNLPENNSVVNITNFGFNFTAIDMEDSSLDNCSLYTNFTGSWQVNETLFGVANGTPTAFLLAPDDGAYIWNVECFDDNGASDYFEHNLTVIVNASPNITNAVQNDGPANEGDLIHFNATCTNPGDTYQLLVCNSSAAFCNLDTPANDIVCLGEFTTTDNATCTLTTNETHAGTHTGDTAVCCDDGGLCTPNAQTVSSWTVEGAPVVIINGSDQGSDVTNPTVAGLSVNFSITAVDPNADATYKLIVCNSTSRSGINCLVDEEYCSDFASDGEEAECLYSATSALSGNYSWWMWVCDSSLCAGPYNYSEATGSPFYINANATMLNTTPDNYLLTFGDQMNMSTTGAADNEDDPLRLQCGNSSGGPYTNLCVGEYGLGERDCSFSIPWQDNTTHSIYCVLNDSYSTSGYNETIILVDNGQPAITLELPQNASYDTDGNITFNFTATDSAIDACHLYGSWVPGGWGINQTNLTVQSGQITNWDPVDLAEGAYLWNVFCNDTLGNEAYAASNFTINVDTSAPIVTQISPADEAIWDASQEVTFRYSATDIGTNISSCTLVINNTLNETDSSVIEGNPNEEILATIPDGTYNWSINCSDGNGLIGNSSTRSITIAVANIAPSIVVASPSDDTYTNNPNVTLFYNLSDDKGIHNCTLAVDEIFNQTNSTTINETGINNFTLENVALGRHNWSVTCTDNAGQPASTALSVFYVDIGSPFVELVSPENASIFTESDRVPFRYNVTDNEAANIANCSLFVNDIVSTPIQQGVPQSATNTFLRTMEDQDLTWYVECFDLAGNNDTSEIFNLTVNASLKLWNNTFNLTGKTEGVWYATTNALSDWFYPISYNDSRNFTLDTSPPNITLVFPANNTNTTNTSILFIYNTTDELSNVSNCSLYIDDTEVIINTSINGITNNFTYNLSYGDHNWSVQCYDYVGNLAASEQFSLEIIFKDLFINSTYITFDNSDPEEFYPLQINATIFNLGEEDITENFIVNFSVYNRTEKFLIESIVVQGLNASSNMTLNATWVAAQGNHTIEVALDTEADVSESNETNNVANKSIFIDSYHVYFGNVSTEIGLGDTANLSVYSWINHSEAVGNFYIVDSDSSISWLNVTALGRNITAHERIEDFDELDQALELNYTADSINATYLVNSTLRANRTFEVYGTNITNVSIINSTNSSDFVTGILWDASDGNEGNYNGSQDVIFVTNVELGGNGQFGVYDYEARIPGNLRNYIKPNNEDSIELYFELK